MSSKFSFRALTIVLLIHASEACLGPTGPGSPYLHGIITEYRPSDGLRTILVAPESGGAAVGVECGGVYFSVSSHTPVYRLGGGKKNLDYLRVGLVVSVEHGSEQLDSCPPIRSAKSIFVE